MFALSLKGISSVTPRQSNLCATWFEHTAKLPSSGGSGSYPNSTYSGAFTAESRRREYGAYDEDEYQQSERSARGR